MHKTLQLKQNLSFKSWRSLFAAGRVQRKEKLKKRGLVALAVSLDGNFVQFSLGNNGNLGVEGDAK